MNYSEVLDYLFTSLPVYQKIGGKAVKIDLGNILLLSAALDNPHRDLQVIHIAGTNGKGSVSHMLASILTAAGYRTGLYTSPHFLDFRERIRVDGNCISEKDVVDFVMNNKGLFEEIKPSFFEMTVALAFHHFRTENVDFAIIETGLGGRLDSTNIVDPVLSIITNISYDHQEFLGDTLVEIAGEKAGIIKSGRPTIVGIRDEDYFSVIEQKANQMDSSLRVASEEIAVKIVHRDPRSMQLMVTGEIKDLPKIIEVPFSGIYQTENLATVLCSLDELKLISGVVVSEKNIIDGLKTLGRENYFPGRWQILQEGPRVIADGAHNVGGVRKIIENLAFEKYQNLHLVLGFSKGKDAKDLLDLLPAGARYYFCKADIHRAMPLNILREYCIAQKLDSEFHQGVGAAFESALQQAGPADLILVSGSIYLVADLLVHLTEP